jgi:hypothetical protein
MGEWVKVSYRHWIYFDPSLFINLLEGVNTMNPKDEPLDDEIETTDDEDTEEVTEAGEDVNEDDEPEETSPPPTKAE